jgi:MSHA pilin protein MshD
MNTVVKSSADPMVRKQALAMADAVLEEVLAKAYADPDGAPNKEASRALWDDVTDYHGETIAGTDLLSGSGTGPLSGYSATIAVAATAALTGVAAYEITVTVSGGPETIVLRGYRAN